MIEVKARLKVASVSVVQGIEGIENIMIDFVIADSSPRIPLMPQNMFKETSEKPSQAQKGLKKAFTQRVKSPQYRKIVLIFTSEELEAFNIHPYPSQEYEASILEGSLRFRRVK